MSGPLGGGFPAHIHCRLVLSTEDLGMIVSDVPVSSHLSRPFLVSHPRILMDRIVPRSVCANSLRSFRVG